MINKNKLLSFFVENYGCSLSHRIRLDIPLEIQDFFFEFRIESLQVPGFGNDIELPNSRDLAQFQSEYSSVSEGDFYVIALQGGDAYIYDYDTRTVGRIFHGAGILNMRSSILGIEKFIYGLGVSGLIIKNLRERNADGIDDQAIIDLKKMLNEDYSSQEFSDLLGLLCWI